MRHIQMTFRTLAVPLLLLVFATPAFAQVAQETVDLTVVERIREEGFERSRIEQLARHLTEVIGPRLSGSPGMQAANEWTNRDVHRVGARRMRRSSRGGEFGRGWTHEDYKGRILTPFVQPLHGQPMAWTGSTDGTRDRRGNRSSRAESMSRRSSATAASSQGAFLLTEPMQDFEPEFEHRDRRSSLESLLTPARAPGRRRCDERRAAPGGPGPGILARAGCLENAVMAMAEAEGAHAVLRISSRNDGVIRGGSAGSREAGAPEGLPHVALSREQYNQIYPQCERRGAGPTRDDGSEPLLRGRPSAVQLAGRDTGHRQGRRVRDARRPPRLLAHGWGGRPTMPPAP